MGIESGFIRHDGALLAVNSPRGKQLVVWERQPGERMVHQEYPIMMYRAGKRPDGRLSCHEMNDGIWGTGPSSFGAAEQFSRRCQLIVGEALFDANKLPIVGALERSQAAEQRAYEGGWRRTMVEALENAERIERNIEAETAKRHGGDREMSARAQAEALAIDRATDVMVPVINDEARKALADENERLRQQLKELSSAPKKARKPKAAAPQAS